MTLSERLERAAGQEVLPGDPNERMLEAGARAIYAKRPFRTASTLSAYDAGEMSAVAFDFDGAPAYYTEECREIAAIVLSAALKARETSGE